MANVIPSCLSNDVEKRPLVSIRVKAPVDEVFKCIFVNDPFQDKVHSLRNDSGIIRTSWVPNKDQLPSGMYQFESTPSLTRKEPASLQNRYRKFRFSASGSAMSSGYDNAEYQQVTEFWPGSRYVVEAVTNTAAMYGDKFTAQFRYLLTAEDKNTCSIFVLYCIIFTAPMNSFVKAVITKAIDVNVKPAYKVWRQILESFFTCEDLPASKEAEVFAAGPPGYSPPPSIEPAPVVVEPTRIEPHAIGAAPGSAGMVAQHIVAAADMNVPNIRALPQLTPAEILLSILVPEQLLKHKYMAIVTDFLSSSGLSMPQTRLATQAIALGVTLVLLSVLLEVAKVLFTACRQAKGLAVVACVPLRVVECPESVSEIVVSVLLVAAVGQVITLAMENANQSLPSAQVQQASTASTSIAPPTNTPVAAAASTSVAVAASTQVAPQPPPLQLPPPIEAPAPQAGSTPPAPVTSPNLNMRERSLSLELPTMTKATVTKSVKGNETGSAPSAQPTASKARAAAQGSASSGVSSPEAVEPSRLDRLKAGLKMQFTRTSSAPRAPVEAPIPQATIPPPIPPPLPAPVAAITSMTANYTSKIRSLSPLEMNHNTNAEGIWLSLTHDREHASQSAQPLQHMTQQQQQSPSRQLEMLPQSPPQQHQSQPPPQQQQSQPPQQQQQPQSQWQQQPKPEAVIRSPPSSTTSTAELGIATGMSLSKSSPNFADTYEPQPAVKSPSSSVGDLEDRSSAPLLSHARDAPAGAEHPYSGSLVPRAKKMIVEEPDEVEEDVFENERFQPFRGWGHSWPGHFLPSDRVAHWSSGMNKAHRVTSMIWEEVEPKLPPGWIWLGSRWQVDLTGVEQECVDASGWQYAVDFSFIQYPPKPGSGRSERKSFVRRRRWTRIRIRLRAFEQRVGQFERIPPCISQPPVITTGPVLLELGLTAATPGMYRGDLYSDLNKGNGQYTVTSGAYPTSETDNQSQGTSGAYPSLERVSPNQGSTTELRASSLPLPTPTSSNPVTADQSPGSQQPGEFNSGFSRPDFSGHEHEQEPERPSAPIRSFTFNGPMAEASSSSNAETGTGANVGDNPGWTAAWATWGENPVGTSDMPAKGDDSKGSTARSIWGEYPGSLEARPTVGDNLGRPASTFNGGEYPGDIIAGENPRRTVPKFNWGDYPGDTESDPSLGDNPGWIATWPTLGESLGGAENWSFVGDNPGAGSSTTPSLNSAVRESQPRDRSSDPLHAVQKVDIVRESTSGNYTSRH